MKTRLFPRRDGRMSVFATGMMAERAGFEPARRFPAYTLSRRAPSTARPPLRRLLSSGSRGAGQGREGVSTPQATCDCRRPEFSCRQATGGVSGGCGRVGGSCLPGPGLETAPCLPGGRGRGKCCPSFRGGGTPSQVRRSSGRAPRQAQGRRTPARPPGRPHPSRAVRRRRPRGWRSREGPR